MDKVKCPTCGTENSAKRQICHFCGQLLRAADTAPPSEDSLELVNEELKRAAEAAIRGTGQKPRGTEKQPQKKERKSSDRITITSTSESTRRRQAAKPSPRGGKTGRERLIVAVAAIVTVIALGFLAYRYIVPKRPSRPEANIPPGSISLDAAPMVGGYAYEVSGQGFVLPLSRREATEEEAEEAESEAEETAPVESEPDFERIASAIARSVTPQAMSILSRVSSEVGAPLNVHTDSFRGTLIQKGVESIVVAVTFDGDGFTGSFDVLVRRGDQGWSEGWHAAYFSDFVTNFSPPLAIVGEDGYEERISAVRVGGGGFQPLANAQELPIRITYA